MVIIIFILSILFSSFTYSIQLPDNSLACTYDNTSSPFSKEEVLSAVTLANHTWGYGTSVTISISNDNSNCSIKWEETTNYGQTKILAVSNWILSSDIILSSNNINTLDLLNRTVVHEIGHAIGLSHDADAEIMYPTYSEGSNIYPIPNLIDIAQVASKYPKTYVNGVPVLDCSARTFGLGILLPVVDGILSVRMAPIYEDELVVSWRVIDFMSINRVFDKFNINLCGIINE